MKSWLREPIMALGICCSFSLTWRAPNHQQTSNRKSLRIDTGMYSRQKRHVGLASMTPDTRFCKKKHYDQFQTSDPSWWLHQPIWKYHSNCIISPILGMKATTIWNHQLGLRKWPAKSQEQRQMCMKAMTGGSLVEQLSERKFTKIHPLEILCDFLGMVSLRDPFKGESWPPNRGIKRSRLESPGCYSPLKRNSKSSL